MRPGWLAVVVVAALGCGRAPLAFTIEDEPAGDAGTATNDGAAVRIAKQHRAAGQTCPSARAPGMLRECPPEGSPADSPNGCLHDSECTAGTSGRCVPIIAPFLTCRGRCSYDECFDDSACPAATPCDCRKSEAVFAANECIAGSNCKIDADCGPGGSCSPSVVHAFCGCPSEKLCDSKGHCFAGQTEVPCVCGDACGHGFFCHTKRDDCLDDEDCAGKGTCNFDRLEGRWTCSTCWPIP